MKDPAIMQQIRADWRLRPLLGAIVSPHNCIIPPDTAADLQQKLARRGFPVTAALKTPRPFAAPVRPQAVVPLPLQHKTHDLSALETRLQQALCQGEALTITYFSASDTHATQRVIEPILLYRNGEICYLDAWCRRDDAPRTFRLDRIAHLEIYEDLPPYLG